MISRQSLRKTPLSQIKKLTVWDEEFDAFIDLLLDDPRQGVQAYAASLLNKKAREEKQSAHLASLKKLENRLHEEGYDYICGIDEVGRGPLAGPVVTAAVILPKESNIIGVDDSKKLTQKKRCELEERIKQEALSYAYGVMSPAHIDSMNILNATKCAMVASIGRLKPKPDLLLIDAVELPTDIEQRAVVHGDALCYSIAAASILAKEARDRYMIKQAEIYPQYHFEKNMGYGTKEHLEAIEKYGLTPIHRKSFCKHFL